MKRGNYLRVRGEYHGHIQAPRLIRELPPRARRIQQRRSMGHPQMGTTSACAENTRSVSHTALRRRNYLRVRGEYIFRPPARPDGAELPPRARRIHYLVRYSPVKMGTTSACAENTLRFHPFGYPAANYLRMRGEYSRVRRSAVRIRELPPHARRILQRLREKRRLRGTTSACAENT